MPGHPPRHRTPLRSRLARVAVLWALAACAVAQAPVAARPALQLPLRCTPGVDCWAANYFDVDASTTARDFRCSERTYEGHDGVDFAIRDLGVMQAGVEVLSAAPGVVRNVRDGMFDAAVTDEAGRVRLEGRDCGNGVVIDHPGGWQTQYCHLRRGSVRVKPGQAVEAGTPLALVGLSGRTEFPHLHFTVRLGQWPVDPFTGLPTEEGCGSVGNVLWAPQAGLAYEEAALYNAGIAPGPPDIEAIRRGERGDGTLPADAPALVLWVDMLGVRAGDRLRLVIRGPDGRVLHEGESTIDRTQARRYQFSGTPRSGSAWAGGVYEGQITLTRTGSEVGQWTSVQKVVIGTPERDKKKAPGALQLASTGTAFRVSDDGSILTNHHVIEDCREIKSGGELMRVVSLDPANDLALLKGPTGKSGRIRESSSVRLGESIVAAGYPLQGVLGSGLQVASGDISAESGLENDGRFFQISAPINPGNSGGPLLDAGGNVVGVVTSKLNALRMLRVTGDIPQNVNFAIKGSIALAFLRSNFINFEVADLDDLKSNVETVEDARSFTMPIECWR